MRIRLATAFRIAIILALAITARGATVTANFTSAATIALTAAGYTATGNSVNLSLGFTPVTGTELTVVRNTALPFITGTFDNLAHGQKVELAYGGVIYEFIANYYGGTGNDLTLGWANTRPTAWGYNNSYQLGDGTFTDRSMPVAVNTAPDSALNGKTVVAVSAGVSHSLALCSDGTVAAWGLNSAGQLGDHTMTDRSVPVTVNTAAGSALNGKTVVAVAAGNSHSLALCSDGSAAAWGSNDRGMLGDNTTTVRISPVAVNTAAGSALNSKTVVAVAAGNSHSLALCSDGSAAAWGDNPYGGLGDSTTTTRFTPVAVDSSMLAYGETFARAAGGDRHSLALVAQPYPTLAVTANGLPVQDGSNYPVPSPNANLGATPVGGDPSVKTFTIRNTGGAPLILTGSPPVSLGGTHAADFTITRQPASPVAPGEGVTFEVAFHANAPWLRTAGLSIASNDPVQPTYDFAIFGTGRETLAAGYVTGNEVPLATATGFTATGSVVNLSLGHAPATGASFTVVACTGAGFISGAFDNLAHGQRVSLPYGGANYEFVANYYGDTGNDLTLVWANSHPSAWGMNLYGQLGDGTTTNRSLPVAVNTATGSTLYGKTVTAVSAGASHSLALAAFPLSSDSSLSDLAVSSGILSPAFAGAITSYSASVPNAVAALTVTVTPTDAHATVRVNGSPLASGTPSAPIPLTVGANVITLLVTAQTGTTTSYQLTLTRAAAPPATTTASPLPPATIGTPYYQTITATGGATPYLWSIPTGSLPADLGLGDDGLIAGTPNASGTFVFVARITDALGQIAERELILVVSGGGGGTYTDWQATRFTAEELANPAVSGDTADPDHDGIPNLLECALAMQPKTADTAGKLPTAAQPDGHLTFTFRQSKNAVSLTIVPQATTDLTASSWSAAGLAETKREDMGDHWLVTVRDSSPVTTTTRRFMRLQVSK